MNMASAIAEMISGVLPPPEELALTLSTVAIQYTNASDPRYRDFGNKLFAEMLAFVNVESVIKRTAAEAEKPLDATQELGLDYPPPSHDKPSVLSPSAFDGRTQIPSQLPTPPASSMPTPIGPSLMQTPGSTPTSGAAGKPVPAFMRVLDERDIVSPGKKTVKCRWPNCTAVMPAKLMAKHCRGHIDTTGGETSQVQCLWKGCATGTVQLRNFDRHILNTHNDVGLVTCSVCGDQKRSDSYKTYHGGARFCTRPRKAKAVAALAAQDAPVASSSSAVAPLPGPGNPSSMLQTAHTMALQPFAPTISSHIGPIRSASTARRDRQAHQGTPYSLESRPCWGILPP
ncbi:hypothetical protein ONZ51_g12278 [Trametes cubensis]|uniref:Uncharacterized protein n=1 Tax=Trametes cubensis TaxID=1111947 RepID=A0AAD7TG00_9APHY|nr:hypothetical protein ONZ51_g12278 [Trametes cubensis]